jgi:hypothetical protein
VISITDWSATLEKPKAKKDADLTRSPNNRYSRALISPLQRLLGAEAVRIATDSLRSFSRRIVPRSLDSAGFALVDSPEFCGSSWPRFLAQFSTWTVSSEASRPEQEAALWRRGETPRGRLQDRTERRGTVACRAELQPDRLSRQSVTHWTRRRGRHRNASSVSPSVSRGCCDLCHRSRFAQACFQRQRRHRRDCFALHPTCRRDGVGQFVENRGFVLIRTTARTEDAFPARLAIAKSNIPTTLLADVLW